MKRIEKVGALISNVLSYPVWIVREHKGYKIQKVNDGSFLTEYNEILIFRNLNEIIEYFNN